MKPEGARNELHEAIGLPRGTLDFDAREAWRVYGIMSEVAAAPAKLDRIRPLVAVAFYGVRLAR
jgi:hypothetical protein